MERTSVNIELVEDNETDSSLMEAMKNLISCKSLYIDIGLMFFYQFAGYNVVTSFAGSILKRDEEAIFNITLDESHTEIK